MSDVECHLCGRDLTGLTGWVEDVKIIEPDRVRLIQRYTCDDCESKR